MKLTDFSQTKKGEEVKETNWHRLAFSFSNLTSWLR